MNDKNILVHICCGPCGAAFVPGIINGGFTPVLLWHNHNIHPYTEYQSRKNAAIDFANSYCLKIETDNNYGLRDFLARMPDFDTRCASCYEKRLEYTAARAKEHGFAKFSTTLLASPYQNFDLICELGRKIGAAHGLEFVIRDFRAGYRDALKKARANGLYMQKYCGCIFSEEERYHNLN